MGPSSFFSCRVIFHFHDCRCCIKVTYQLLPSDPFIPQMEVTQPLKRSVKTPKWVTAKNLVYNSLLRWGSKSNDLITNYSCLPYMFTIKIGHKDGFFCDGFADGGVAHIHTYTHCDSQVHFSPSPQKKRNHRLLIKSTEDWHRTWKSWFGSDNFPLPKVCSVFSGSCAVNLPGCIRWPEGMNPQGSPHSWTLELTHEKWPSFKRQQNISQKRIMIQGGGAVTLPEA